MKTHLLSGILFSLLIITLAVIGFITEPVTALNKSVIIEAPTPVIWNKVSNIRDYQRWCARTDFSAIVEDSLNSTFYRTAKYEIAGNQIELVEKIVIDKEKQVISIMPRDKYPTSYLEGFHNLISVNALPDGSTEVRWKMRYTIKPLVARMLNRTALSPALENFISTSLSNLKTNIE